MTVKKECEQHGLSGSELACLTGYSYRAISSLCHLREAWIISDDKRRPLVEVACGAILESLDDLRLSALGENVLRHSNGYGAQLVRSARATIAIRDVAPSAKETALLGALIALEETNRSGYDFEPFIVGKLVSNGYARKIPGEDAGDHSDYGLAITDTGRAKLTAWRRTR